MHVTKHGAKQCEDPAGRAVGSKRQKLSDTVIILFDFLLNVLL